MYGDACICICCDPSFYRETFSLLPALPPLYASVRLEFLVYDPCSWKKCRLSAAAMPVLISDLDGRFMVKAVDAFMAEAYPFVRGLAFDGHGAHGLVRRALQGTLDEEEKELLTGLGLKFFSDLQYRDLPEHGLPRLPIRLATFRGEFIYCIGGPCVLVCEPPFRKLL